MSDTWQLLQRIQAVEARALELELQLSVAQVHVKELQQQMNAVALQLADKVSLSPEGPKPSGAVRVSETPPSEIRFPDEPSDDDWLSRLAGLETAPESDPLQIHDDEDSWPELD